MFQNNAIVQDTFRPQLQSRNLSAYNRKSSGLVAIGFAEVLHEVHPRLSMSDIVRTPLALEL